MLTKEQALAVVCYTVAMSFMYILPLMLLLERIGTPLIGEAPAYILGTVLGGIGAYKIANWCSEAFQ